MKVNFTRLATFALAIGVNYSAFSQWGLTGNVIGAGNWLGTINNQPLDFRTNTVQDLNPYAVFSCHCSPPKSSTLKH